jgi:peroxiredoxin Q/BCP
MRVGDVIQDFILPDQTWTPQRMSSLVSRGPVVLFFYPAAFNPLCTVEHCRFRDVTAEFSAVGALPVGISADSVARQAAFDKKYSLGYMLLSDFDGEIGQRFDVVRDMKNRWVRYRRHTYIIGPGLRILDIIRSEIRFSAHADLALQFLRGTYKAVGRAQIRPS